MTRASRPAEGRSRRAAVARLRARILSHAGKVFLSEGFVRVPMDQIAADLGMSKKTLYTAFPSKEELVADVIRNLLGDIREHLERMQKSDGSFPEKFRNLLEFFGETGSRIRRPFLQDLQRHAPDLWSRIEQFRRDRILTVFSSLFDQGVREGYVRPGVDRRIFISAYLAAVEAVVNPSFLMHEAISASEAIRTILELFFHGAFSTHAGRRVKLIRPLNTIQAKKGSLR